MSDETKNTNTSTKSEKKGSGLWIWLLTAILVVLAALFIIDKLKSNKKYKALDEEYQQTSAEYLKYKSENESYKENFSDLEKRYAELTGKLDTLKDSSQISQAEIQKMKTLLAKQDSLIKIVNNLVNKAMSGFDKDELQVQIKNGAIYVTMLDKLLFQSGSAQVEKKGLNALKTLSKVLINNPDFGILVEGHTDNLPIKTKQYKDNWDLSVARATNIVRILSDCGLPSKRLTAAGRGEFYPVVSNSNEAGRAKNRRTEIILTPNLDDLYKAVAK